MEAGETHAHVGTRLKRNQIRDIAMGSDTIEMMETTSGQGTSAGPAQESGFRGAADLIAHVAGDGAIPLKPGDVEQMSDVVEGGVQYVQSNFEYDIRLDDIATAAGLSKFHFIRKFRDEVGKTPGAFLQHIRIFEAMKQLCATNDPVGKIGKRVGYRDAAAFSRAFARITGTQPRRFRQKARQAVAMRHP